LSITTMGGRLISVYRRTAFIIEETSIVAVVAITRAPPAGVGGVVVSITISGGTGNIVVSGNVNGVPASETLSYAGAGTKRTIKLFETVDFLACDAGLFGNTLSALSLGVDGSRQNCKYLVVSDVQCHLNRGGASWRNTDAGTAETERTWFGIDYTNAWQPREGDVFLDQWSNEQWFVVGTPNWLGGLRPHHWEVRVKRREGSLNS
jgi:hypothetical protein